jgi:hypothetical protein
VRSKCRLGAMLWLLASTGCRQVLGIEQRSEGNAPLSLGDACGSCVEAQCDDAERACAANPECAAAAECMSAAGVDNPNGRAGCARDHAKAVASPAFEAIDACMRTSCQTACYGTTGFFAAYSQDCQLCTEQTCGDVPSRCVQDAACEAAAVRAFELGPEAHDPARIGRLTSAGGEEGEDEREIGYCPIGCPLDCGFAGDNLTCVSEFAWPINNPASVEVEIQVNLFHLDGTEEPVPGAKVDVCQQAATDCLPVSTATTDATGLAKTELDLSFSAGFRGFVRARPTEVGGSLTTETRLFAYPILQDTRGLLPVLSEQTLVEGAEFVADGITPGRAQIVLQYFDCSMRRATNVSAGVPEDVLDGATLLYFPSGTADKTTDDGLAVIYNAKPGCFDVIGRDEEGRETHRMRLNAAPDVVTWAYVLPTSEPPDIGHLCVPAFE